MAEFQKRKAQENLSAVLANMGLRLSKDEPSETDGEALDPGPSSRRGLPDVVHSPEPPAPPPATAPRDPGEH